ncbi:DMT family transporter [Bacillus sp. DNRA2]|uniref:DMT family transporter n=1 Tax=Bacillus sp. DNRA2 TaxID=2723053 RepID=UPI002006ED3C|nr:DMT family transporter [Bacillus sp. DNRA2]
MASRNKRFIYITLVLVMIAWGLNVIATKLLVTSFSPVTITAFRIFAASICVFIILGAMKKVRIPTKREVKFIIIGGLFNVVAHHFFLSLGLKETTASNGGLILGLGPLLTTILAIAFLGATLTMARIVGVLLGFTGVALVVLKNGNVSGVSIGDLFVFISILSQAISFIFISKIAKTLDPRLMTGYMLLFGSLVLFVISLVVEPKGLQSLANGSALVWLVFFASAFIATAVGHMVYNFSVGQIGAAETSIFINLNPFFALLGAVIFLHEKIVLSQIFGFCFIIAGVVVGSDLWIEIIRNSRKNKMKNLSA